MRRVFFVLSMTALVSISAQGMERSPKENLTNGAANDDIELIKESIARGASINEPLENGDYPLHIAVQTGSINAALFLVRQGASLEQTNNFGITPLEMAKLQKTEDNAHMYDVLIWELRHNSMDIQTEAQENTNTTQIISIDYLPLTPRGLSTIKE